MSHPNRMPTLVRPSMTGHLSRMPSVGGSFEPSIPHRSQQTVIVAMTLASLTDAGCDAYVRDIDGIIKSIQLVSRSFAAISRRLAALDRSQRGVKSFLTRWNALYEQYKTIIQISKENARSIATYSQELGDVVLPYVIGEAINSAQPTITYNHKIAMVDQFSSQSHVFHEKAARLHHLHHNLLTELSFFLASFPTDISSKSQHNADDEEVRRLLESCSILRGQMTEYHRWLSNLDIGPSQTLKAMEGLSVAFPAATPTVLTPAMTALGLQAAAAEVNHRAAQYHSNVYQLNLRLERLAAIFSKRTEIRFLHQEIRHLVESTLPTLLGSLGVLQRIWAFVHSECEQIKTWILSSKDYMRWDEDIKALPPVLYVYVMEESTIHTSLSNALLLYAERATWDL